MAYNIYLEIADISDGANTEDSIGQFAVAEHEDEITVLEFRWGMRIPTDGLSGQITGNRRTPPNRNFLFDRPLTVDDRETDFLSRDIRLFRCAFFKRRMDGGEVSDPRFFGPRCRRCPPERVTARAFD